MYHTKFIATGPRDSMKTVGPMNQFLPVRAKTRRAEKPGDNVSASRKRRKPLNVAITRPRNVAQNRKHSECFRVWSASSIRWLGGQ